MVFLKEQWKKYTARKTKAGIVLDFVFLALFLAMLHPTSRTTVMSAIIKYTMMSPSVEKDKVVLKDEDYNWKFQDFDGQMHNFKAYEGKVVLLNFWATWCPPCVAEMPSLQELYNAYGDKIEFVLITGDPKSQVKPFLTQRNYTLPVYMAVDLVPDVLKSKSIPVTYLISKKGEIILHKTGAAKWHSDKVKDLLDKLLAE